MHEFPITMSILSIVLEHARAAQASKVTGVNLTIGQLSGIVPECVQLQFSILSRDTMAADAALSFNRPPSRLRCRNCGVGGADRPGNFQARRTALVLSRLLQHPALRDCQGCFYNGASPIPVIQQAPAAEPEKTGNCHDALRSHHAAGAAAAGLGNGHHFPGGFCSDAFLGGLSVGAVKLDSLKTQWITTKRRIEPDQERKKVYDQLYPLFKALYANTKTIIHQLADFQK